MSHKKNVDQKELKLMEAELKHRTYNFLNLLCSLLRIKLNSAKSAETKEFAGEIVTIIDSFCRLFDSLLSVDKENKIKSNELFKDIILSLKRFPLVKEQGIEIDQSIEPLEISANCIVPLTLITIESFTNTVKHAFPDTLEYQKEVVKKFSIVLQKNKQDTVLVLQDNGAGCSSGRKAGHEVIEKDNTCDSKSGFSIMQALARQMKGSLKINADRGTTVEVLFPVA